VSAGEQAAPSDEPRVPLTFKGETAWYTLSELEILGRLSVTEENEKAAAFIHACKVHLDAELVR
jgi:hypothetical protein